MKREKAVLFRAEMLDDLLVFKANYQKFQFCRHAHEDFALGLMEGGTQKFNCCGEEYCAPPGSLISVNAGEVHDGMSADGGEYRYRIIYIPESLLQKVGAEMINDRGQHYFSRPVIVDSMLAESLACLFLLLETSAVDLLELQTLFYGLLAELLTRHGTSSAAVSAHAQQAPRAIERACEFINDMAKENISLDEIAAAAGLSRYHFLRVFNQSLGMTPHAFLLLRRLQLARESIRRGSAIADAALETCFADQSHFSRRFKAAYGITPRQFQKAVC